MTISFLDGRGEYLNTISISDFKALLLAMRPFVTLNMMKKALYTWGKMIFFQSKSFFFFVDIFTFLSGLFGHAKVNL